MSSQRSALFLGLLAGCGPTPIELIVGADIEAIILAREQLSGIELEAFALASERPLRFELDPVEEEPLYVLTYEDPLADLGLPEMILALDPAGGPLPPAMQIFEISDETDAEPEILDELPTSLAALRLAASNPCMRFAVETPRPIPQIPEGEARFFVAIDDARALLGSSNGHMYLVEANSVKEFPSPLEGRELIAGVRTADGEIWLVDSSGATARGHPDQGFTPGPSVPLSPSVAFAFAASPAPRAHELYVATSTLAVYELLEDRWIPIPHEGARVLSRARLQLSWMGPGRVALVGADDETMIELGRGAPATVQELPVPLRPSQDALHAMSWVEGVGAVVGTRYSTHFKRGPEAWELLPEPARNPVVYFILDLGGGSFLSGGESGAVEQWLPSRGQCPPIGIVMDGRRVGFAVKRTDGFMTVTGERTDSIGVSLFRRL